MCGAVRGEGRQASFFFLFFFSNCFLDMLCSVRDDLDTYAKPPTIKIKIKIKIPLVERKLHVLLQSSAQPPIHRTPLPIPHPPEKHSPPTHSAIGLE